MLDCGFDSCRFEFVDRAAAVDMDKFYHRLLMDTYRFCVCM